MKRRLGIPAPSNLADRTAFYEVSRRRWAGLALLGLPLSAVSPKIIEPTGGFGDLRMVRFPTREPPLILADMGDPKDCPLDGGRLRFVVSGPGNTCRPPGDKGALPTGVAGMRRHWITTVANDGGYSTK